MIFVFLLAFMSTLSEATPLLNSELPKLTKTKNINTIAIIMSYASWYAAYEQ